VPLLYASIHLSTKEAGALVYLLCVLMLFHLLDFASYPPSRLPPPHTHSTSQQAQHTPGQGSRSTPSPAAAPSPASSFENLVQLWSEGYVYPSLPPSLPLSLPPSLPPSSFPSLPPSPPFLQGDRPPRFFQDFDVVPWVKGIAAVSAAFFVFYLYQGEGGRGGGREGREGGVDLKRMPCACTRRMDSRV